MWIVAGPYVHKVRQSKAGHCQRQGNGRATYARNPYQHPAAGLAIGGQQIADVSSRATGAHQAGEY